MSYSDPYFSTGDRRGNITCACSGSFSGDVQNLVDGTQGNSFYFSTSSGARTLTFTLAVPMELSGFKWYQDNSTGHGTWVWEHSDDNVTYTPVGSSFTLGGSTLATYSFGAGGAHTYWRMRKTAGSTSNSPYCREIEFDVTSSVPEPAALKVSALEAQVLYDPGPQDLKVSALEAQVLYSARRVDFAGFETLSALTTPAVGEYGGFEVLVAVSKKQKPRGARVATIQITNYDGLPPPPAPFELHQAGTLPAVGGEFARAFATVGSPFGLVYESMGVSVVWVPEGHTIRWGEDFSYSFLGDMQAIAWLTDYVPGVSGHETLLLRLSADGPAVTTPDIGVRTPPSDYLAPNRTLTFTGDTLLVLSSDTADSYVLDFTAP